MSEKLEEWWRLHRVAGVYDGTEEGVEGVNRIGVTSSLTMTISHQI